MFIPYYFYGLFINVSFVQAYLWEFTYTTNLGLLKNIYITFTGVFEQTWFEDYFYWPRSHTYKEAIYLIIICFLVLLINKYIPLKDIISQILHKNKKALFIFMFAEWALLFIITENGMGQIGTGNLTASLIVALVVIFCLLLLYIRSIIKITSTEKKLYDMRTHAIERQYHELNIAYEKYRCVVHDEKNMLFYLLECLEQNEPEKAKEFLISYQGKLNRNGKQTWTGISTLDFLLNIKKQQMDTAAIKFHLDCQIDSIYLEDGDFVSMFGNLLDNAIEAAMKCEKEQREIYLSLKNINEMLYFKIKNSCTARPTQKNHRFLTSKKDEKEHGWGIESVKFIVAKYNGDISFSYDGNFFEVKIII